MPAGFYRLIAAQFTSAVADNALLIVGIAWLKALNHPDWWAPLLKLFFTLAYVVFAPWVGPLADRWPKARVMAVMNLVKIAGLLLLLAGVSPLLAFAVAGVGAAAYAPAKYGLLTELVPPHLLVRANAWLEVSVVGAAIFGTLVGGLIVSAPSQDFLWGWSTQWWSVLAADWQGGKKIFSLQLGMVCVLAVYLMASLLNWGLPDSGKRYPRESLDVQRVFRTFVNANRSLWRDALGGLSLSVTTLFWGVGATLQIAVIHWADRVMGLTVDEGSILQVIVAAGVVVGAAAAGRWVPLHAARKVLGAGVLLGVSIAASAVSTSVADAAVWLGISGFLAGVLVVPLNALLQHRGYVLLSAGSSIAVQNFNENLSVLCMLAVYSLLLGHDFDIVTIMLMGAGFVSALMLVLMLRRSTGQRGVAESQV
ncbi:MAG: lysophospholipid transporter LplT [Betaproteobacteria bacterium]|jgi:MFS transporter, LPLT family, lysophospholipid transporter|nr:lysophospholipid transporter LplT [Betaproteobacteria bacterium]NBS45635.1 lysophospholipid transporter LplT [Betaproteobacteria bacterium]